MIRFLVLFLFCLNAWATTPVISNVTGYTGTPGETLTITGTTMQDESISTLLSNWATSSNAAFYMTNSCCAPDNPSDTIYGAEYATDQSVVNNSNSYKLNWAGASPGNLVAEWYLNTPYSRTTGSKWKGGYIRTRTTGSWPSGFLKMFSEYGSAVQGGCFLELFGGVNFNILCTNFNFGSGTGSFHTITIPGGWIDQQWNLVEWKLPCGGTDTIEVWLNNRLLFNPSLTGGGACNSTGAYPSNLTNASGTASNFNQDWWFDGFYESSARIGPLSLIEITSGSNYAATSYAAGTRAYQPPISLSNTSSTSKLVLPSGGAPYYLWVTNQQGQLSSGHLLGGAPVPAPTYLRIRAQ